MRKALVPVLFILVALTWGTTWLAMRIAAETIPPVFATGMRFIFAAPFLIAIAWQGRIPLLFPKGQRSFQFVIGIFYFAIPFSLMIYGETYVSSGLASVIFANMPVVVLIASIWLLNERTSPLQIIGLIIAIVSLTGILLEETKTDTGNHWQGVLALVSAVVIHALIYTQCKKRSCAVSVITFNALPCFFAGVILLTVGGYLNTLRYQHFLHTLFYPRSTLGPLRVYLVYCATSPCKSKPVHFRLRWYSWFSLLSRSAWKAMFMGMPSQNIQ